jgi:protein-disulfide isomerase
MRKMPWSVIALGALVMSLVANGSLWSDNRYLISQIISASSSSQHFADVSSVQRPTAPGPTGVAGKITAVSAADHIRGKQDAKIILVEFSDFECPFCKTGHETIKKIAADYGDKVAWVYREFPLSIHANAQKEAEAGECIADLGGNDKFWNYADTIFSRTTSNGYGFSLDKLPALAAEIGVDQPAFSECLDSGKFAQKVKDEITDGSVAGVTGTPGTIMIKKDGTKQLITGALPYETFKSIIDTALN